MEMYVGVTTGCRVQLFYIQPAEYASLHDATRTSSLHLYHRNALYNFSFRPSSALNGFEQPRDQRVVGRDV
jgi:hypothetical protein